MASSGSTQGMDKLKDVGQQVLKSAGDKAMSTVTDKLGEPRFIVPVCWRTNVPRRPSSTPSTCSIATYPAEPLVPVIALSI